MRRPTPSSMGMNPAPTCNRHPLKFSDTLNQSHLLTPPLPSTSKGILSIAESRGLSRVYLGFDPLLLLVIFHEDTKHSEKVRALVMNWHEAPESCEEMLTRLT